MCRPEQVSPSSVDRFVTRTFRVVVTCVSTITTWHATTCLTNHCGWLRLLPRKPPVPLLGPHPLQTSAPPRYSAHYDATLPGARLSAAPRTAPHHTVPRPATPLRTEPHRSVGRVGSGRRCRSWRARWAADRLLHARCCNAVARCCFLAIFATLRAPGGAILYTDTCFVAGGTRARRSIVARVQRCRATPPGR